MDKAAPFSIGDEFFQTQLLKDLAINVYKNEKWGCFVKLPIDELVPEKVRHAFVLRKINGLKSSLKWYKGDIKEYVMKFKKKLSVIIFNFVYLLISNGFSDQTSKTRILFKYITPQLILAMC